jgi:plastocyanin domain-containing protein
MRTMVLLLVAGLATACRSSDGAGPAPRPAEIERAADGSRQIAIAVSRKGYQPASLTAEAGERLTLVFSRSEDVECGRLVKVPGVPGETELPVGQPVAIPVTMPADGELVFTCGMDMFRGVVTVAK